MHLCMHRCTNIYIYICVCMCVSTYNYTYPTVRSLTISCLLWFYLSHIVWNMLGSSLQLMVKRVWMHLFDLLFVWINVEAKFTCYNLEHVPTICSRYVSLYPILVKATIPPTNIWESQTEENCLAKPCLTGCMLVGEMVAQQITPDTFHTTNNGPRMNRSNTKPGFRLGVLDVGQELC